LNNEKIWKLWQKRKLNSEKIWKVWKNTKLNSEKIRKYGRKISWILKWFGKYDIFSLFITSSYSIFNSHVTFLPDQMCCSNGYSQSNNLHYIKTSFPLCPSISRWCSSLYEYLITVSNQLLVFGKMHAKGMLLLIWPSVGFRKYCDMKDL
jgi:hypothetical protein